MLVLIWRQDIRSHHRDTKKNASKSLQILTVMYLDLLTFQRQSYQFDELVQERRHSIASALE